MRLPTDWIVPDWHAPGVGALMTTRQGGASVAPYDSMNVRHGIGDDADSVARNQSVLATAIGALPVWLNQVHGARVVRLGRADLHPGAAAHEADACISTEAGVACAVQVADCLPVLFVAPGSRGVGAAHAGWRGLAGGVLEATVSQLCDAAGCEPGELQAWLGACIGPRQFEVGLDVLEAFGSSAESPDPARFRPHAPGKWLADLAGLAHDRLLRSGLRRVAGGGWCTVEERSRFFSFRRDRVTGRMAAVVWIERFGGP